MNLSISLGIILLLNAIQVLLFARIYIITKNVLYTEKIEVLDVYQLKFACYIKDFNKMYTSEEYQRRFENFKASLKEIAILNAIEGAAVFGLTKFSDMSKQEFAERMLLKRDWSYGCQSRGRMCFKKSNLSSPIDRSSTYDSIIPPAFDWRTKGVVKPVLNQKLCYGCWAFSIIGVMESMAAIRKLDHKSRSIQELLDCTTYTKKCRLGSVSYTMDYLCDDKVNVVTEEEYPLTLGVEDCQLKANSTGRRIKEFDIKCETSETGMLRDIATHGPLIALVDASNWQNYIGGVIRRACGQYDLNHVVQIVGYNTTGDPSIGNIPYYIIRNSHGIDFGEQGYVRVAIYDNVCGIADEITKIDVD